MDNKKISKPSDLVSNLSEKEIKMIQKGKKHWRKVIPKTKGEELTINKETLCYLIDLITEDVWSKAEEFYKKET